MPSIKKMLGIDFPRIEICDVGAMQEGEERYAALMTYDLARVTGFEPNPVELAKLNASGKSNTQYLPYFLGKGGPATFHITRYHGCCSLYEPNPAVINQFTAISSEEQIGNFWVKRTEPVETHRLDDVEGLPALDYIKLDIQGAELDVLQNGVNKLKSVSVIELEVEFVQLYKNQPLFGDVQVFLASQGFVLHKFLDIAGRCYRPWLIDNNPQSPLSQVLWADAIFVRNVFDLSVYSNDQLLKTAAILYHVYNSYDLAYILLAEYDRRTSANIANKFAQSCNSTTLTPKYMNLKLHA